MQLGRYEVIRTLGQGGTAKVLLAKSAAGQAVVLKVPLRAVPDQLERLRDEARVGLRLQHPAIVETLDLFEHEGKPILVVEYVEGPTLQQIRRLGPLPAAAVARIGRQVAEALAAIHEARDEHDRPLGILHRDVSPANILVNREGDAKLIDLGIARSVETQARATQAGAVRGTLRYLAPELLAGKKHSATTDLWALGVSLWEAALGRRSMEGDDTSILRRIQKTQVMEYLPGEQLDPRLHDVLAALIADENSRIQRAQAAANILRRLEEELGDGQDACITAVEHTLRARRVADEGVGDSTAELIAAAGAGAETAATDAENSVDTQPQPRPMAHLDASMGSDDRAPTLQMRASEIAEIGGGASPAPEGSAPLVEERKPTARIPTSASAPDTLPGGDKREPSSISDTLPGDLGSGPSSHSDVFRGKSSDPESPVPSWEEPTRHDRSGPLAPVPSPAPVEAPLSLSSPAPALAPAPAGPAAASPLVPHFAPIKTNPDDIVNPIDTEGPTMIRPRDDNAADAVKDSRSDGPHPGASMSRDPRSTLMMFAPGYGRTELEPPGPRPVSGIDAAPSRGRDAPLAPLIPSPDEVTARSAPRSSADVSAVPKPESEKAEPAETVPELASFSDLPTEIAAPAEVLADAAKGREAPPGAGDAIGGSSGGLLADRPTPAPGAVHPTSPPPGPRQGPQPTTPAPRPSAPSPSTRPPSGARPAAAPAPAPRPASASSPQPPTATQAFFAADVHHHLEKNGAQGLDDPTTTGELEAAFKPRPGLALAVGLIGLIVLLAVSYVGYWWWAQRGAAGGGAAPASDAPAASDVAAPPDAEAPAPVEQNPAPVDG